MVSKKLAIEVLNAALSTGADYAEIFYEDSHYHNIVIENGKVESCASNSNNGVGIRLLKQNQCVYGFTSELTRKGLLTLANSLNKSFSGKVKVKVTKLEKIECRTRNRIKISYDDVPMKTKIELIKEGIDEIKKIKDPRIVRTISGFNDWHRKVVVFNSKSKWFKRDTEFSRLSYQVVASDGKGFEVGYVNKGCQDDINYYTTKKVNPKKMGREAAETALRMLGAAECPSGIMPVVIANGWGGVLFHESCGHPLEASAVSKGLSCFKPEQVGQYIASPIVSAVDDPTIPYGWGSIDIDDEGNICERHLLINHGKLNDFMIDDLSGRRMNRKGNGASRRQSYRYAPTSRMSNTYICNGRSKPADIIKATKLGLYAVQFGGGQVDPSTGEFNFGCSEAYIIRDGKIAEPVKGATLIGKGYEILKKIDMVANDLDLAQGFCGAASGSIYTNVGQPTIRLSECAVGGRGGELK